MSSLKDSTGNDSPLPPLASYSRLAHLSNKKATGKYQIRVGDLCLSTNEWDKAAAEKWLPLIVEAVNALVTVKIDRKSCGTHRGVKIYRRRLFLRNLKELRSGTVKEGKPILKQTAYVIAPSKKGESYLYDTIEKVVEVIDSNWNNAGWKDTPKDRARFAEVMQS